MQFPRSEIFASNRLKLVNEHPSQSYLITALSHQHVVLHLSLCPTTYTSTHIIPSSEPARIGCKFRIRFGNQSTDAHVVNVGFDDNIASIRQQRSVSPVTITLLHTNYIDEKRSHVGRSYQV